MYECILCRWLVVLDDVEVRQGAIRCVCVRCYRRETCTDKPMPSVLRKWLAQLLNEIAA